MSSYETINERMTVENWRRINFERLGFSIFDATKYAEDNSIDFHEVENFLKEHPNCKPETALKIVR